MLAFVECADDRHKGAFDRAVEYLNIAKGHGYEIIAGGEGYILKLVV